MLEDILVFIYCVCALGLFVMSINCYIMVWLFRRRLKGSYKNIEFLRQKFIDEKLPYPVVTTQIPIFNEYNVGERIINAVINFDYPKDKHQIQILDDSSDETRNLLKAIVERCARQGFDIQYIHRKDRKGFKAGALAEAMAEVKGDFIALFDADFVPPKNFLKQIVPGFLDEKVGLIQGRWGHLNDKYSILTRIQAIGIDGHFAIEQSARDWNELFMNFNGTAGVFRKQAILDGGGWSDDTLTEDMDLSYRIQLAGYTSCYMLDVCCPAEIPEDINAFKSQQFRWAKGSIQTAKKLLPRIIISKVGFFKKLQAFIHMTHYMIHPFMLLCAVLSLPIYLYTDFTFFGFSLSILFAMIILSSIAPSFLYLNAQKFFYDDWRSRLSYLPALVCIGTGLAFNNTIAVCEAIIGKKVALYARRKKAINRVRCIK